jgi:thaumatin family protein
MRRRTSRNTRGEHGGSGHRSAMRPRGGPAAAVVLLACCALVAGVLLARAEHAGTPGRGTTAAETPPSAAALTPGAQASAAPTRTTASPAASSRPEPTRTAHPAKPRPSRPATGAPAKAPAGIALRPGPGQRTMTLVNRLRQTIWPAIAADPEHPVAATGWVLAPGASLSFLIPDHWDVRLWARTGCSFDAAGDGHCVTGDCGHFQCGRTWGEFPSTLAEFNLNAWNGMDFYDVSLVEGNNLPMWINNSGGSGPDRINADGCSPAGCTADANTRCPTALQRTHNGAVVACLSTCLVLKTDQTCCTGAYAARPACVPAKWPINSAAVFKKAEPFAYSYVNDDASSVLTCSGACDYRVTWGVSP